MDDGQPPWLGDLLDPSAYPGDVDSVEAAETHISYLFFAGGHVYKVKKPVDFGFLDFTSLEKRRDCCHSEVALNRRISPDLYLGVAEIREEGGRHALDGPGRTVEYAVKMVRLPRERAMDLLLRQGLVGPDDVEGIAAKVARFHRDAEHGPHVTRHGDLRSVRLNVEENFAQTRAHVGLTLPADLYDDLAAYSRAFLDARSRLFAARAGEGRIRDCHGDLHTAQIFLEAPETRGDGDGVGIIDCIEFNRRFRYSDVAEDIAFLAMDLDHYGRPDLSRAFVDAYVRESGDPGVLGLLDFFKVYRAYVRGKVAGFRLDDPHLSVEAREEAAEAARSYFLLAHSYLPRLPRPGVILVAGLPGTGKTAVAGELARRWGMAHISSDVTRKTLAGVDLTEHRYVPFSEDIYSPEFSELTYRSMFLETAERLRDGERVVLDATFRRAGERRNAVAAARDAGAEAWVVECTLPEEPARRRLEDRFEAGTSVSDGCWELYHRQMAEWEPVTEVPRDRLLRVDTSGSPEDTIRLVLQGFYAAVV